MTYLVTLPMYRLYQLYDLMVSSSCRIERIILSHFFPLRFCDFESSHSTIATHFPPGHFLTSRWCQNDQLRQADLLSNCCTAHEFRPTHRRGIELTPKRCSAGKTGMSSRLATALATHVPCTLPTRTEPVISPSIIAVQGESITALSQAIERLHCPRLFTLQRSVQPKSGRTNQQ